MYVFVLFTYCMYIIYLFTLLYLLIAWLRIMCIDMHMYTRGSDMIFPEHVAVGDPVTAMRSHKGKKTHVARPQPRRELINGQTCLHNAYP